MTLTPLGDQAVIAYAASESAAIRFASAVRLAQPDWLEDVVPAYASVGVFFNADRIGIDAVLDWLRGIRISNVKVDAETRKHAIPVCYELGLDGPRIANLLKLKLDEVISRHVGSAYTVYAIGFVPGFPYLGYLPEELTGVPRLNSPRTRVEPGSVGLTGRQTGIYPLPRPGGWNILGRTPLTIVDVADGFFPIRVGDTVQFTRIDDSEYRRLAGERLPSR